MRGAGGSEGGIWQFFIGLTMIIGGGYLFLTSVRVHSGFHWGHSLYSYGGVSMTGGMVLIPFIFGIAFLFYNARNPVGWVLTLGSLLALGFGILRGIQMVLTGMTLFDLLVILVLLFGGIGLFLSSLRDFSRRQEA
jgi:hypothetical protein